MLKILVGQTNTRLQGDLQVYSATPDTNIVQKTNTVIKAGRQLTTHRACTMSFENRSLEFTQILYLDGELAEASIFGRYIRLSDLEELRPRTLKEITAALLERFREVVPKEKCPHCHGTKRISVSNSEAPDVDYPDRRCSCADGTTGKISVSDQALIDRAEHAIQNAPVTD